VTAGRVTQKSGRARRDKVRTTVLSIVERQLRAGETFADISVGSLVAEAGISRTTFYVYFEDKTDLLRTWYAEITEVILDAAQRWWSLDGSATKADLRAALEQIVDAYRPHPELMAATHEAIGYDHDVRATVEESMRQYVNGLREHIEVGQRAGFVDPELPTGETSYLLQWMAERGLPRIARAESRSKYERLIEAYSSIVWNTLYAPTRRTGT
jgi:TetR/AcrR family transcriptional regulator, ethionamide resistance regulator